MFLRNRTSQPERQTRAQSCVPGHEAQARSRRQPRRRKRGALHGAAGAAGAHERGGRQERKDAREERRGHQAAARLRLRLRSRRRLGRQAREALRWRRAQRSVQLIQRSVSEAQSCPAGRRSLAVGAAGVGVQRQARQRGGVHVERHLVAQRLGGCGKRVQAVRAAAVRSRQLGAARAQPLRQRDVAHHGGRRWRRHRPRPKRIPLRRRGPSLKTRCQCAPNRSACARAAAARAREATHLPRQPLALGRALAHPVRRKQRQRRKHQPRRELGRQRRRSLLRNCRHRQHVRRARHHALGCSAHVRQHHALSADARDDALQRFGLQAAQPRPIAQDEQHAARKVRHRVLHRRCGGCGERRRRTHDARGRAGCCGRRGEAAARAARGCGAARRAAARLERGARGE